MAQRLTTILKKILKGIAWALLVLFVLFVILVLVIRTPWAQQKIVNEVTTYVGKKVDTKFEIKRLFLTFRGNVQLEGLYLEDQTQDTLVYIKELEAGVSIIPLINGNISISRIDWDGLVANVTRDKDSIFNFDFLIDAFAGEPKTDNTTAKSDSTLPNIGVGPIDLANLHLKYRDEIIGLESKINLGKLKLRTKDLDLNTMEIKLRRLELSNVTGEVNQWLSPASNNEDEEPDNTPLPFISFNEINLRNISLQYRSKLDSIDTAIKLGNLQITDTKVNLNKQDIKVDDITLNKTDMFAHIPAPLPKDTTQVDSSPPTPFVWPDWTITVDNLDMADNIIVFKMGSPTETPQQFNSNDITLIGLNLKLQNAELKDQKAQLQMQRFAFREKSGFELNQLAFDLKLDEKQVEINDFELQTPNNQLQTNIKLAYAALDSLIQQPTNSTFDININEGNLSLDDAFYFAPELKEDTFIQSINPYPLAIKGKITGRMEDVEISKLELSWLHALQLSMNGKVQGLPDTNNIKVDIPNLKLDLTKKDLMVFVELPPDSSVNLPNKVNLQTQLQGSDKDLQANLKVATDMGNIRLTANLKNIMGNPAAKGILELDEINLAQLTAVQDLEPVSLKLEFDEQGKNLETLSLDAQLAFQKLTFQNYDYSNLKLDIEAAEQKASINLAHTDKNLDFLLKLDALLDTVNPAIDMELDLRGADLQAMGLNPDPIKVGAELKAAFKAQGASFESWVNINKGTIVQGENVHRLQPIEAKLNNAPSKTELDINSNIINGNLRANTSIDSVVGALTGYLNRLTSVDSIRGGIMDDTLDVTAHFTINNSRILTEVALPELTQMDTIQLDLEFHPSQNQLSLNLNAPKLIYADYALDSLGLNAKADVAELQGALAFRQLKGGPVNIHKTRVDFGFKDNIADIKLSVRDSLGEKLTVIGADVDVNTPDTSLVHIAFEELILNGERWSIPQVNEISITDGGSIYNQVLLTNGSQELKLSNITSGDPNGLKLSFRGFELSSFTTILHTNDSLLSGALDGSFQLTDIKSKPGIKADVRLNKLTLLGNPIGVLELQASNRNKDKYDVNLSIKGNSIDFTAEGAFLSSENPSLDMQADLNRLDMKLVEGFVPEQLKNSSGSIEGNCKVSGPTSDIKYKGYIVSNGATFNAKAVNTQFTLSKDKIEVSDEGLVFNKFSLIDANGQKVTVDGSVDTKSMINPTYKLSVVADNFQVMNSSRDDNDLFFGKAYIDTDAKITGTMRVPNVKVKAKLRKGSDITFIVPETQAEIEARKGLVTFANMRDTLNVILKPTEDEDIGAFTSMNLTGYFEVDPATQFTIVIDERSGDKIQIAGEANLNLDMTANGLMTLSGTYEVGEGSYDMNFYGIAKRNFELVAGSRIVWSGDPLDGELDLTAQYDVKTSPRDLMADQLTQGDETTSQYRQELPFEVILNINGRLLKPEISFGLDMPESKRQAMGGNVYKRIQQLNESESELNKQVFSLIVLNRFLIQPSDGNGDGTDATGIARSSVSKMLSGQLNAYSSKYLKGVELNFDLNSYTDYENGGEYRTDLDVSLRKALFNDRLVFQVGSQVGIEGSDRSYEASDIIGDVSLEYLLTKEGQYRLKAFRQNQYQDLVEGQLVETGVSILFNKDFNGFNELFKKVPKPAEESGEEPTKPVEDEKPGEDKP